MYYVWKVYHHLLLCIGFGCNTVYPWNSEKSCVDSNTSLTLRRHSGEKCVFILGGTIPLRHGLRSTWMRRELVEGRRLSLWVGREGSTTLRTTCKLWSVTTSQCGMVWTSERSLNSTLLWLYNPTALRVTAGGLPPLNSFIVILIYLCECMSDSDMAEIPPPPPQSQPVEIDPDFEPLSRPRSCTWPLPRPELLDPAGSNTSSPAPSAQQESGGNPEFISSLGLLEEDYEEYEEQKPPVKPCTDFHCRDGNCVQLHHQHRHHLQQQPQVPGPQLPPPPQQQVPPPAGVSPVGGSAQRKSGLSSSRRNAWGNMSYADLITKAIDNSPEKRLTLSQIYEWMVKSVPYFKDKGDSNSSAGWKVSVRLHEPEMLQWWFLLS